jgi:NAD(P)-dependent dehydrogenase (short-subunit alcohol dehydrogenase family)
MAKIVLLTGASSGIGKVTAEHLTAHGYTVYGTSRNPHPDTTRPFEMVRLDVTDADSVTACVEEVMGRAGRIDILVNNAGVELLGAIEETSIDEARQLFETNFYGVARMVQAVLPHMRERGNGTIINISSQAGLSSVPFQGYYAASKHAIEAYSEALSYEVEPFGVRVALVEPGIFHSEIAGGRRVRPQQPIPAYDGARDRAISGWEGYIERGNTPEPVAEMVLRIADRRTRRLRHQVSTMDSKGSIFAKAAPEFLMRWYIKRWSGLVAHPFSKKPD